MQPSCSLSQFLSFAKDVDFAPLWVEVSSDIFTPVEVYLSLTSQRSPSYLLESVEMGNLSARFSFIGVEPSGLWVIDDEDPVVILRDVLKNYRIAPVEMGLPFNLGLVGYISYDVVRFFEPVDLKKQDLYPEAIFMMPRLQVCFDHKEKRMKIVYWIDVKGKTNNEKKRLYKEGSCVLQKLLKKINRSKGLIPIRADILDLGKGFKLDFSKVVSNVERKDFLNKVKKAKDYIYNGDIIQVVLSQRFEMKTTADPFVVYRILRLLNPSPYMFFMNFPKHRLTVLGSSPEMLIRVSKNIVETHPIAGTRRRGKDLEEDKKLAQELISDEKERAEHIMLVDLGRNDLGRVCKLGSVGVEDFMHIEYYSHVMHIVSRVVGRLSDGRDALDVLRVSFPAGTVTGAPKIRAMEIISELEPDPRGIYAGSIGYIDFSGNMDMCIAIRTIVFYNNKSYIQAGAGIVADSVPELEYKETQNKARAQILAVSIAEKLCRQIRR